VVIPPKEIQEKIDNLYGIAVCKEIEALKFISTAKKLIEDEIEKKIKHLPNREKTFSINSSNLAYIWTPEYYQPQYINTLKLLNKELPCSPLHKEATISKGDEVGSNNYRGYFDKSDQDVPFIRTTTSSIMR